MSTLNTTHAQAFHAEHGDPTTWAAVDFEVHQNLALMDRAARRERWRRPVRRAAALLLTAYVLPLYLLAEVVHQVRGFAWLPLDHHLDRVDDRFAAIEQSGIRAGDQAFVERLGAAVDRVTDKVSRLVAGPARP
ncbi:hypothetical protein [Kitasatospora sp. HPMI-4]|uniref:hypothetical protein n=1 Tax=Kitasatospora sp. HPMI-4 TaxID=3448443 RepID=UPI003F1CDFE6